MADNQANKDKITVLNGMCPCRKLTAKCYNFVVVGSTGAGKTTLCDSLVNYLLGVEF